MSRVRNVKILWTSVSTSGDEKTHQKRFPRAELWESDIAHRALELTQVKNLRLSDTSKRKQKKTCISPHKSTTNVTNILSHDSCYEAINDNDPDNAKC